MNLKNSLLLATLSGAATAAALTLPPPGQLHNLTGWDLQLPLSDGGGGVQIIKGKALQTYSSIYFNTSATDGHSMSFWCPENGAHTSGSNYPRSELREELDFDLSAGSFHRLNATLTVVRTTPKNSITIGQAHVDGVSGACSIFVELEWAGGDIVSHMRDSKCKGVSVTVGTGYKLGDPISYSIVVAGNTAFVSTDRGSQDKPYAYLWLKTSTPVYFKSGNYLQDTGSSASVGSLVLISELTTEHRA